MAIVGLGALATAAIIVNGLVGWQVRRVERLARDCRRAHEAGDYQTEERLATLWGRARPEASEPLFLLAQAQLGLGKKRDAAATFDRLPDGDRLTVLALGDRADLLFGELQDPRAAAATCERILRLDPRNVEAHRRLCFFYAATLQRRRLAAQARAAIELGCETPEAFVYAIASDWLTLSNTFSVNSHWLQAAPDDELFLVAAARGFVSNSGLEEEVADPEEADGEPMARPVPEHDLRLRELLARFPGNLELLAYFLHKAITRGDLEEVTTLLGQAPPEAAGDNRFWRFKGWVHFQDDQTEEAVAAFRTALEIDPFDFSAQHQLGGALRRMGDLDEAARLSERAARGRGLRKTILKQPDVRIMDPAVLGEIAEYARRCGDADLAGRLAARLGQIGPRPGPPPPLNRPRQPAATEPAGRPIP
jgi:tetratricopeptide (TPR) repeat protein